MEAPKILACSYELKLVDLVVTLRVSFLIPTFYSWEIASSPEGVRGLSRIILLVRTMHFHCSIQSLCYLFCLLSLGIFQGSFLSPLSPIAFASSNHYHNLKRKKKITSSRMTCKHLFQVQSLYRTQDSHLQWPTDVSLQLFIGI